MLPMSQDLGWSIGEMSAPQGLRLALFGLAAPFAGGLMLRYGPRRMLGWSGLLLLAGLTLTVLMTVALASYHPGDPALNTASGGDPANLIGPPGAWFADIALSLFGPIVALLLPIGLVTAGAFGFVRMRDDSRADQ